MSAEERSSVEPQNPLRSLKKTLQPRPRSDSSHWPARPAEVALGYLCMSFNRVNVNVDMYVRVYRKVGRYQPTLVGGTTRLPVPFQGDGELGEHRIRTSTTCRCIVFPSQPRRFRVFLGVLRLTRRFRTAVLEVMPWSLSFARAVMQGSCHGPSIFLSFCRA